MIYSGVGFALKDAEKISLASADSRTQRSRGWRGMGYRSTCFVTFLRWATWTLSYGSRAPSWRTTLPSMRRTPTSP